MSKKQYLLILALAVIAITLCSQCSPIYAFNDGYDINCFMTIGRGMLEGKLPYRDMFDHKGPLVYALYAFANLISRDSFIGVYFIEIFFAFLFLVNVYKICEEYKSKLKKSIIGKAKPSYSGTNYRGNPQYGCYGHNGYNPYDEENWD